MKKILLLLSALTGSTMSAFSQSWCATPFQPSKLPASVYANPVKRTGSLTANRTAANTTCYYVRVFFHLVRNSNGSGGQPTSVIPQEMAFLKAAYAPHQIYFVNAGFDEIRNDNFTNNIDQNKYNTIINTQVAANALNVYLLDNSSNFNSGLANDNPGRAVVIGGAVSGQNLTPSPVIAHEIGHCLGLYHTFETSKGAELVNGTNCTTAGDLVCDTPAESPAYPFTENSSCVYTTNYQDSNGQTYHPDLRNIMDYMRPSCLEHFTEGQSDRMKATIANSSTLAAFASTTPIAPVVQGPTQICSSSNIYTTNISSSTIQWSSSNPNIATINASTGVAAAVGTGTVVFTATATDDCNTTSGSISVNVGASNITGVYYQNGYHTMTGFDNVSAGTITMTMQPSSGVNYSFSTQFPTTTVYQNTAGSNTAYFYIGPAGGSNSRVQINITASGSCGTTTSSYQFNIPSYSYAVSPNPTASELTVQATSLAAPQFNTRSSLEANSQAVAPDAVFEVQLYNSYGQLVKIGKSQQGKITLNVLDLPNGLYTLRGGNGKDVISEHIQITH